jgi:hypothetical protein
LRDGHEDDRNNNDKTAPAKKSEDDSTNTKTILIRELPITNADNPFGDDAVKDTTGLGIWCASLVMTRWMVSKSILGLAAWRNGHQLTLQPDFAKSDRKFQRKETLSSAQVAADRSGNERAVRLSKMSGYLKRGLSNNQSLERFDQAWLAWGFQINFMFQKVL